MFGTFPGSTLSRRRCFRPALVCASLLAGLPQAASAWISLVELKFDEASGTTTGNSGSVGGSGTLSATTPSRSTQGPISGGPGALDFGNSEGNYYVDLTSSAALTAVKNLKSFTIAGWVNCRSSQANIGGGGIVCRYKWQYRGGVQGLSPDG